MSDQWLRYLVVIWPATLHFSPYLDETKWTTKHASVWFGFFYGISNIVGYLMPILVYTYILNIWFVNTFCRYTQLNDQTVLFLTIQSSIKHLFNHGLNIKQFYLTHRKVLPLWARVDLGVISMKGYSTFPKAPVVIRASQSDCLMLYPGQSLRQGFYPSAEI